MEGLCYRCQQILDGRRRNVKTRNFIETEEKADGVMLPVRGRRFREVEVSEVPSQKCGKPEKIRCQNDAGRKREDVRQRDFKAENGKRDGGRYKAHEVYRRSKEFGKKRYTKGNS